jgi:hypothetical protein
MKLARWTAVVTLAAMFHLHAQTPASVPPSPASAAGPTMEITLSFINEAFKKTGEFHYDAGDEIGPPQFPGYEGSCGQKSDSVEVHTQSVSLQDNSALIFVSSSTKTITDTECIADKHGAKIDKATNRFVTNVSTTKADLVTRNELRLDAVDPRTVIVASNEVVRWSIRSTGVDTNLESGYYPAKTTPETYIINIKRPSSQTKGVIETVAVGTFYDKDLADRVAKAYIHAIVLCHKPEAPSLF